LRVAGWFFRSNHLSMTLLAYRAASNRLRVSPAARLWSVAYMIFLCAASSVGNFPAASPAGEQARLWAATRFQIEALTAVLSFPRKRQFRSRQS
jgi:hypothetical protein